MLAVYDEPAYPAAAVGTGARNEPDPSEDRGPLNRMNALCASPGHWLSKFGGVSTRRLANYLAWFTWALDARWAGPALVLLAEEVRTRAYPTTRRGYAATPYPSTRSSTSRRACPERVNTAICFS